MSIHAEALCKRYGDSYALRGVDLHVPTGTVLGLLGPNGAGKTTVVRILSTLLPADSGRATVAGHEVSAEPKRVRMRIGLTGQYAAVDERLTGRENLTLIGQLHHRGKRAALRRAGELLERFDLCAAADRPVKTYSGGMRRRVDLAASLVDEPAVLFLDEPTTGLDPASRQVLWDIIAGQVREGTTVLLTTQYLEEADRLADRIAVLGEGSVIAEGTQAELKRRVGGERLRIALADPSDVDSAVHTLETLFTERPLLDPESGTISFATREGIDTLAEVTGRLREARIEVAEFGTSRPSLDDVFLSLVGGMDSPVNTDKVGSPA
ncbi:daunorubicin resistance protein DrrA family ABC transporter ATP-binding protein [Sciscionella marina]|uniref:daunorubicin resistance protein DrrA family ABC transporter ATP-binding protein n=1 Tax=Sciscionella marina TaxID=508770 RepID=UPI0003794691|nr:daunorubicin resistance protein DrrA family ABC transporter ATP-binding protein [Sciscionella marina]